MFKASKTCVVATLLGLAFAVSPTFAAIVTFEIEIDGATGMFDAPDTGGLLDSFSITIDGVTFDTLAPGNAAPVYNAVNNDIRGNPGTEGFVTNSAAGLGCDAMECVLAMEDSVDPGVVPALFAIFPLIGGIPGTVTNSGNYSITPPATVPTIPLPASFPLLLATLGGLAWRFRAID